MKVLLSIGLLATGWLLGQYWQMQFASRPPDLPSISEIQELVGATPDGKLCKSWNVPNHSETQRLWNEAICDQYARIYINADTMKGD